MENQSIKRQGQTVYETGGKRTSGKIRGLECEARQVKKFRGQEDK